MLEGQGRPRGGEILSLAPVRDHRSEVLARGPSHPAASLPGHFVPGSGILARPGRLEGTRLLLCGSQEGEKGPSFCSRKSGVRNAPFTSSMARCSCRFLEAERGPSLLGQGKERGPCGQRNLLQFIRKPTPAGLVRPAEEGEGPYAVGPAL